MRFAIAALTACSAAIAAAAPQPDAGAASYFGKSCPPISGDLTVNQYQLYPENLEFDPRQCLVYFGSLFNASVAIYDPYKKKTVDILEFPGITHNPLFHVGGVDFDPNTGYMSIVVDAAAAFNTLGVDVTGPNYVILYDPKTKKILYQIDVSKVTGEKYGGFQDLEQDPRSNVYVVGTFPASILRVSAYNPKSRAPPKVEPWYLSLPLNTTRFGTSGLASTGDVLLSNDNSIGQIVRFDTRAAKGVPVVVPHYPNTTITFSDAIYLPPKYSGTVLLVSENGAGVSVLRSRDGKWKAAEYLGLIPTPADVTATGGLLTATTQIANSLYMNIEYFADPIVPGQSAGNRTAFPLVDITRQVAALLK